MEGISSVTRGSTLNTFNTYMEMDERDFYLQYDSDAAEMISADEGAFSDGKSITSYDIGDCITVFAIEKQGSKNEAINGWHISRDNSIDDIKNLFGGVFGAEDHDFYIIGGNESTTHGEGCLLENIHK